MSGRARPDSVSSASPKGHSHLPCGPAEPTSWAAPKESVPMTTAVAETTELHDTLKPGALLAYSQYILSRTRADLQGLMKPMVLADLTPDPTDPLVADVANGASVVVHSAADAN